MLNNTNNGSLPTTTATTEQAPERASLWTVDAKGIGQGKPHLSGELLADVQAAYRTMVAEGRVPMTLRITPAGKRPDSLGYKGHNGVYRR